MKKASLLAPYRRLLVLCGLSLLLHLAAIAWIAQRHAPAAMPAMRGTPISVRLQAAVPVAATQAEPPPARVQEAPAPSTPAGQPSAPALQAEPAAEAPAGVAVQLPSSARLSYALSRGAAGQPAQAAGSASIAWKTDGQSYQLQLDGVAGRIDSEGIADSGGIRPLSASETRDGSATVTRFERSGTRILDRASMLLELTRLGQEREERMAGVIEVGAGPAPTRFEVAGRDTLGTALGMMNTLHLVQLVAPGETRFELWLAPDRNWYPVQLRSTNPDGTVNTQSITAIEVESVPRQ